MLPVANGLKIITVKKLNFTVQVCDKPELVCYQLQMDSKLLQLFCVQNIFALCFNVIMYCS